MRVGTVFFEMQLCPVIDSANFVTRKNIKLITVITNTGVNLPAVSDKRLI